MPLGALWRQRFIAAYGHRMDENRTETGAARAWLLVPGGYVAHETPTARADVYDPQSGTWTAGGSMSDNRTGEVALVLRGNRGVLVMGGLDHSPATTASVDIGQTH